MPSGREFRGKPSRGCESCRGRRVKVHLTLSIHPLVHAGYSQVDNRKCDQSKPACAKCAKLGIECVYRDLLELAFRNETSKAAQIAQTRWRQRAKSRQSSSTNSSASSELSSGSQSPTISGSLVRTDLRTMATNRFLYDYCLYVTKQSRLYQSS
jgi:hypothetical protein